MNRKNIFISFCLFMSMVFSLCLSIQAYAASKKCFGGNDLYAKNRFERCDKGDVITVITMIAHKNHKTVNDMAEGVMFLNEVSDFCSFEHQITLVGKPVSQMVGYPARAFDCVYIGRKRESTIEREK